MDSLIQSVSVLPSSLNMARAQKNNATREEMEATAKEFESVFMAQMLKPMWQGLETNEMFGGGVGEDVMRDMLVQEYGKAMVKGDGGQLSSAIIEAMVRLQEQANGGV